MNLRNWSKIDGGGVQDYAQHHTCIRYSLELHQQQKWIGEFRLADNDLLYDAVIGFCRATSASPPHVSH